MPIFVIDRFHSGHSFIPLSLSPSIPSAGKLGVIYFNIAVIKIISL